MMLKRFPLVFVCSCRFWSFDKMNFYTTYGACPKSQDTVDSVFFKIVKTPVVSVLHEKIGCIPLHSTGNILIRLEKIGQSLPLLPLPLTCLSPLVFSVSLAGSASLCDFVGFASKLSPFFEYSTQTVATQRYSSLFG